MMTRIETYASDEWVHSLSLVREDGDGECCRDTSLELVQATLALCRDWISPLAVSLRMESRDPNEHYFVDDAHPPAHRFWFLRQRNLDENVLPRPDWVNPEVRIVESIAPAELLAFVEEALNQSPSIESREIALPELSVNALGISLPEGVELEPLYDGRPVHPVVIHDGMRATVLGPKFGVVGATPARLRALSSQYGTASIKLELCWDFWTKHPAGREQLRNALERVLSRGRGWQLESGEMPRLG
jgi:hypothetical protein